MKLASRKAFETAADLLRELHKLLNTWEDITMRYESNIDCFVYTKSSNALYYYRIKTDSLKDITCAGAILVAAAEINREWEELK